MLRLLFAIGLGAALMYLFDPREGRRRREVLGERLHQTSDAAQQAKATVSDAKERFTTTVSHAQERFGHATVEAEQGASETIEETGTQAEEPVESASQREVESNG